MLLVPTLLHGLPFVYWDTAQYYEYGKKLFDFVVNHLLHTTPSNLTAPTTVTTESTGMAFWGTRSPFYSLLFYVIAQIFSLWGVLVAQTAVIGWLIWRAATHAGRESCFEVALAITALCTFGSSAWLYAGFAMPDIFASVGLISVALLFGYADRMSISERLGLTALLAISAVFHITHLMTAAVVGFAGLAATFGLQPQRIALWRRSVLVTASALAVAITMNFAFDATARAVLGASPKRPPLLTARVIVDGPGRLYLDGFCPIKDEFAVCAYRHRGFRTADEFLWEVLPTTGVFSTLPLDQRLKIIEQEPRFIAAVFRQYPLAVFKAIVANAVEQLTLVLPAEAYIDPGKQFGDLPFRNADLFEVAPFLNDCVAQLGSCVPTIPEGLIAAIVGMTTVLSLGVIALHFLACRRIIGKQAVDRRYHGAIVFTFLIVVGVIVNAGICGAVSGPHERYQARVMWLLLVAAGMLEAASPIIIARFSWAENRGFAGVRLFKRSASRALSWVRAVDL